jgi:hypothetical protein
MRSEVDNSRRSYAPAIHIAGEDLSAAIQNEAITIYDGSKGKMNLRCIPFADITSE